MNIDLIRNITKGAYNIYSKNDTVFFERFTKKQQMAYCINDGLIARSVCASGISFDFITDSSYVKIDCKIICRARDVGYFDLYIDNIFTETIGKDTADSEETVVFNIPDNGRTKHRITIYLPHLLEIGIVNFEVDENATVKPVKKEDKLLLCLGDSITQGMDAKFPSSAYPVQIARELKMELLNQSVGGYVYNSKSLDKDLYVNPNIVIVAYGTNDWNVCNDKVSLQNNINDYFNTLTAIYDPKIINVITPIWRYDIDESKAVSFEELSGIIKKSALKYGITNVINGMNLLPHNLKFYAGDTNIHPSDFGFMHYTKNLLKNLEY